MTKRNEHMWEEDLQMEVGMPIVIKDAKGLGKYPLWKGQEGMANQLVSVDGQDLVMFMPDNSTRMYYIERSRVVINAEKIAAWLEANG
jgi:hypothetical protein